MTEYLYTQQTYLKSNDGKCLHYYVYFIDDDLGRCYLRVPTWCPFRRQFYSNGHSYLARQLTQHNIAYRVWDNTFGWVADLERAQKPADGLSAEMVPRKLDGFAGRYCPVIQLFGQSYHWSLNQVEFATDIVFARQADLQTIYSLAPLRELLLAGNRRYLELISTVEDDRAGTSR